MSGVHTFRVECPTEAGEAVAVTGSSSQLGQWRKQGIILLNKEDNHSNVWTATCPLDKGEHLYRYVVVVVLRHHRKNSHHPPTDHPHVIVRRCETHILPRKVHPQESYVDLEEFGLVDRVERIQRGWLTEEIAVQFKISGNAIHIWKRKYQKHKLQVKVTPVVRETGFQDDEELELDSSNFMEESMDLTQLRNNGRKGWPIVEVAGLTKDNCDRRVQSQFGMGYQNSEDGFLLFEAQVLIPHTVAFLVDIYGRREGSSENDIPDHIGICYIYPDNLKHTLGRLETPIISLKHQPIGKLHADYLFVHPMKDAECDFSLSYRKYWNERWNGLDVGHRGLGNSYTKEQHCSNIRENTIASMKDALAHGADMVEFDVQVSKDLIPILFHEFTVCVKTKKKSGEEMMLEVPVKDLTVDELQGLQSHHPSEKNAAERTFSNDSADDHQPFPTLQHTLLTLDPHLGFNIEIKIGGCFKNGDEEQKHPMEMNLFIDRIIKTVLNHGHDRNIVFSSFNPDACTMINLKQNKYPVLLLTQGKSGKYEDYRDPRTWNISNAVCFAEMAEILGISVIASDVMKEPEQVNLVKERDQVIFCWTDDKNDKETVKYLKDIGINGIIYDRMDQNNEKDIKESVFIKGSNGKALSDSGLSGFSSGGSSPNASPSTISPKDSPIRNSPKTSPARESSSVEQPNRERAISFSGLFS